VVAGAVVEGVRSDAEPPPPPPPHAARSNATAPSATAGRTARSTGAPLHTKPDCPSQVATLRSASTRGELGTAGL